MDNPLKLRVPDDKIEQVHAFAKDLVFGAVNGDWDAILKLRDGTSWINDPRNLTDDITSNLLLFQSKWQDIPSLNLLILFGYLAKETEHGKLGTSLPYSSEYLLTPKAFALLEKPSAPPSIFVSYRRAQSSALALLVEARLKLADKNIGVFIDKSIPPGAGWHAHLEERIRGSKYFVCLIGQDTLDSPYVQKEIDWALNAQCTIISICHNGYILNDKNKPARQELQDRQAIIVASESAEEYELAMIKLLNSLGYATY